MQGDIVWRLTAVPLTPIHVGDGSVLAPEEWRLGKDGQVERFSPSAVLRDMPEPVRRNYVLALDRGDLQGGQRILRDAVRKEHVIRTVPVGPAAEDELRQAVINPLRKSEVRPFVRTAGRPYLPGSSLKGAIRTALLSHLAQGRRREVEGSKRDNPPSRGGWGRASDRIQRGLLGHETTDQDPFRFVRVADTLLPENGTRIDRVVNWRPARLIKGGQQPAEKMQMIFERALAMTDGGAVPRLELEIRVDVASLREVQRRDARKAPQRALDATELARAINEFHWKLFDDERERFFADEPDIRERLAAALRLRAGGRELDERTIRARGDVLLLRVGRFGQFESKSLDGAREGWNAQAKPPRGMKVGNTRNLVRTAAGEPLVPLGWLLLCPPDFEPPLPQRRPAAQVPASSRRGTPSVPPPPPARKAFLDGEPVEVVQRRGNEVLVRSPGGDTEWVDHGELEWE